MCILFGENPSRNTQGRVCRALWYILWHSLAHRHKQWTWHSCDTFMTVDSRSHPPPLPRRQHQSQQQQMPSRHLLLSKVFFIYLLLPLANLVLTKWNYRTRWCADTTTTTLPAAPKTRVWVVIHAFIRYFFFLFIFPPATRVRAIVHVLHLIFFVFFWILDLFMPITIPTGHLLPAGTPTPPARLPGGELGRGCQQVNKKKPKNASVRRVFRF